MSSIYSNCLINIAASRSEDANMGCFALRNRLLIRPCEIIWHSFTPGRSRYTVVLENFFYHDLKTAKRWLGPYRAPSWSWASIDGPIMLTDVFNGSVVATLEEVQLGFVDEKNKTGQLRSARLKIRAVVGSATWTIPKPFQIFHLGFAIDGTDAALPSPGAVQMLSFDHFEEIFSDQQGAIAVVLAESVYADSKELQGLVLKPAGTGSDETYRRIGAWQIQGKDVDMIRFFRDIEPKVIAIV
jgi:hypothetical protein